MFPAETRRPRLMSLSLMVSLLVFWEVMHRAHYMDLIPHFLLPGPLQIFWEFGISFGDVSTFRHLSVTMARLLVAYALAIIVAIPFGLALGVKLVYYQIAEPFIELLRPIPSISLLALGMLLFGIGSGPVIFVAFYGCFFVLLVAVLYGAYSVDRTPIQVIRSMRGSLWNIFVLVVFPASMPAIFGGLRQALGTALVLVVAGEMMIGDVGLGYYLVEAQRTFLIPRTYATLLTLGLVGYLLTKALLVLEVRVLRWKILTRYTERNYDEPSAFGRDSRTAPGATHGSQAW